MENNIQKVKIDPLYDSSIPLLSIYPKKIKALTWKDICTPIFTAALSTITKIWMQPKFFSTNKWVIKIWHLHLYWYIPPSRITALSWQSGLCNSMKLWTMPCKATQDRQIIAESSDKMWSTGGGNGKPPYFLWEPHELYKRQKRYDTKRWVPQVWRCPTCYWGRGEENYH